MMAAILLFFAPFFVPALLIAGIVGLILCALVFVFFFVPIKLYITKSDTAKSGWKPRLVCRDLLLAALFCATLYAVGRAVFFPYKSPQQIFQEEVTLPAPPSMRLVEHEHAHGVTWIHFQISPADLKMILKEGQYAEDHKDDVHIFQNVENPSWWKVEEMSGMRIYTRQPNPYADPNDGNIGKHFLFVNSQNNDVYYRYITPSWDEV